MVDFHRPIHELHKVILNCVCIQSTHGCQLKNKEEQRSKKFHFWHDKRHCYHRRLFRVAAYNICWVSTLYINGAEMQNNPSEALSG